MSDWWCRVFGHRWYAPITPVPFNSCWFCLRCKKHECASPRREQR